MSDFKAPHLRETPPKSGKFQYRLEYPADVRHLFPKASRFGTLDAGTIDVAMRQFRPIKAAHKAEIAKARGKPIAKQMEAAETFQERMAVILATLPSLPVEVRQIVERQFYTSLVGSEDGSQGRGHRVQEIGPAAFLDRYHDLVARQFGRDNRPPAPSLSDLSALPSDDAMAALRRHAQAAQSDQETQALADRLSPALQALGLAEPPDTLSNVAERWIKAKPREPNTVRRLRSQIKAMVDVIGDVPFASISDTALHDFLAGLDTATTTRNVYHATIKALWGWAVRRKIIQIDASEHLERHEDKRTPSEKKRRFTREELADIVTAAKTRWGEESERFVILMVAIYTGARLEEPVSMLHTHLRQIDGQWFLDIRNHDKRRQRLKTPSSERLVPVHTDILTMLTTYAARTPSSGFLFPTYANRGDNLSEQFANLIKTNVAIGDGGKVSWHSLRHSWEAAAVAAEMPDRVRMALIGEKPRGRQGLYDSAPEREQCVRWIGKMDPLGLRQAAQSSLAGA